MSAAQVVFAAAAVPALLAVLAERRERWGRAARLWALTAAVCFASIVVDWIWP